MESMFNAYLWNASDDKATGAKVSWNVVCTPKKEFVASTKQSGVVKRKELALG